jgi:hypothetical protein
MTQLLRFFLCSILLTSFFACGNDASVRESATETAHKEVAELNAPPHQAEGKIAFRSGNNLTLVNGDVLKMPPGSDTSVVTIILVRHAERDSTKNATLSMNGQARGARLAELFEGAAIEQIYVDGNPAMQTGLMTQKANLCDLGTFQPKVMDNILKVLVHSFKGKKTMLVGSKETITQALNTLAGKIYTSKIPDDQYDNIFIAFVKKMGDAEIHHYTY